VVVKKITYRELSAEMERMLGDQAEGRQAEHDAEELLGKADKSFIDKNLVVRSMIFDRCLRSLMARHGCNAFTIDCFEFCPSLLPQKWLVVPCSSIAVRQRGVRVVVRGGFRNPAGDAAPDGVRTNRATRGTPIRGPAARSASIIAPRA
jgi:hypothetical protein